MKPWRFTKIGQKPIGESTKTPMGVVFGILRMKPRNITTGPLVVAMLKVSPQKRGVQEIKKTWVWKCKFKIG